MTFFSPRLGMHAWASAVLFASAALPVAAAITVDQYASPYLNYTTYVDFGARSTVANHWNYNTFNTAEHRNGWAVRYFDIAIAATDQNAPTGRCYGIATSAPTAGIVNDTEILVKIPDNPVWQKLSDDHNGTRYSRARFWFGEGFVDASKIFVRVAPYHTGGNNIDFKFSTSLIRTAANQPVNTEAECFADATIAAAFVDRHENVYIRRAL